MCGRHIEIEKNLLLAHREWCAGCLGNDNDARLPFSRPRSMSDIIVVDGSDNPFCPCTKSFSLKDKISLLDMGFYVHIFTHSHTRANSCTLPTNDFLGALNGITHHRSTEMNEMNENWETEEKAKRCTQNSHTHAIDILGCRALYW